MRIYISYSDLDIETRETLLEQVVYELHKKAKEDGLEQLKKVWNNPQPKTWQEAYIRTYAINWQLWTDYEDRKPDAEIPKKEDWGYWLETNLEDKAEAKLTKAIEDLEIEIVAEI